LRAELKSIFSYDIPDGDLETWVPPEKDFGIYVMLFIGVEGDSKLDCFDILLCTPAWFARYLEKTFVESGQYTIFLHEFDYPKLRAYLDSYIQRCEGDSWPEVAGKLDHLASWEFRTVNTHVSPRSVSERRETVQD
jgi:hypothetical protein